MEIWGTNNYSKSHFLENCIIIQCSFFTQKKSITIILIQLKGNNKWTWKIGEIIQIFTGKNTIVVFTPPWVQLLLKKRKQKTNRLKMNFPYGQTGYWFWIQICACNPISLVVLEGKNIITINHNFNVTIRASLKKRVWRVLQFTSIWLICKWLWF